MADGEKPILSWEQADQIIQDQQRRLEDVAQKLRECDREAALRGWSDTGFPRLLFAAIARSAGPDVRDTLRSITRSDPNVGSTPTPADLADSWPSLFELQQMNAELREQNFRLRMTPTEIKAVREAICGYEHNDDDPDCARIASTLRSLLERLK